MFWSSFSSSLEPRAEICSSTASTPSHRCPWHANSSCASVHSSHRVRGCTDRSVWFFFMQILVKPDMEPYFLTLKEEPPAPGSFRNSLTNALLVVDRLGVLHKSAQVTSILACSIRTSPFHLSIMLPAFM